MTRIKNILSQYQRYTAVITGYIPISFAVFFTGFLLLRYPEVSAQGISDGIDLCLGTLIPTLFPFMVISTLMIKEKLFDRIPYILKRLTETIFSLDGKCLGAIIISMVGGLPVGCKIAADLYESGEISQSQARRLTLFCYCTGPAFTVSSVGLYMLGSKKAGALIYVSLVLSAVSVGVLSRFFEDDDNLYLHTKSPDKKDIFSANLVNSVSSGSGAMLNICAWVILFSCIVKLTEILSSDKALSFFLSCILEVTNGAYLASGNMPLPIVAGIIGFGGLCGHCQVMPYLVKLKMKYKFFFVSRVVCAALSVIYCKLLTDIFPVSYEVFSMGTLPSEKASGVSSAVSVAMLFTAGLFLLGDSAVIRIKRKQTT